MDNDGLKIKLKDSILSHIDDLPFIILDNQKKKIITKFYTIKKMIKRFLKHKMINEKLFLNILIILRNELNTKTLIKILDEIITEKEKPVIKPFLVFLDLLDCDCSYDCDEIIVSILNDRAERWRLNSKKL